MRPLRYYINVTLDGCCDHRAIIPDEDLFRNAIENLDRADADPIPFARDMRALEKPLGLVGGWRSFCDV